VDTFVQQLSAAQQRAGDTPVLAFDPEARESLIAAALACSVESKPLPARLQRRLPLKLSTAADLLRQVAFVRSQLARGGADLLHLHVVGEEGLTAHLGALSSAAPVVVTMHTMRSFVGERPGLRARLTMALTRNLARKIVFSHRDGFAEYLKEGVPARRMAVIPFCADEELFNTTAQAPEEGGPFRILISARLVEDKGHAELLEVVSRLRVQRPKLELLIAGSGPTRPTLEAEALRLGLGGQVRFLGHVGRAEMPALLASVHATALPSYMRGETYPISLLEAALVGLPAVGSRWFGIPDIIKHEETGLLVEPRDVDGLTAAVERLSGDRGLWQQLSAGAWQRGHALYSARNVARQYERVYEDALAPPPGYAPGERALYGRKG
jgi:glycosyltransferase involved in cell wall biosynthesis